MGKTFPKVCQTDKHLILRFVSGLAKAECDEIRNVFDHADTQQAK